MKFSDKVLYLRQKRGLTQEELAKKTNVSQPTIVTWEKGERRPLKNTMIILSLALGVNVDDLMNDEKEIN